MTSPKNDIQELRSILFETLRGVKDGNVSIERGKAVGELTQTIINTAKVEVEFIRATKGKVKGSGFIAELDTPPRPELPDAET
jgi:hypothetical protein